MSVQPIADLDAALNLLEGDTELLLRIVKLFIVQCPQLLHDVREAVRCGDAAVVERAAHKLRGSAANFGADAACAAAQRLEQMGHMRDLAGAAAAEEDLSLALDRLHEVLVEFAEDRAK